MLSYQTKFELNSQVVQIVMINDTQKLMQPYKFN